MPRYAAFLRGINVGGHRITSGELLVVFAELGFRDVAVFRASGNVIFAAPGEAPTEMAGRIERGLEAALGYGVPVFLRTASEVRAIAAHEPFAEDLLAASRGKPQVLLLSARPAPKARREVLALTTDEDRLAFGDAELHWLPSGGTLESPLDFKLIGNVLGPTTIRTKGTVEQVAAKYFAD